MGQPQFTRRSGVRGRRPPGREPLSRINAVDTSDPEDIQAYLDQVPGSEAITAQTV
ncbi:hypothetical protein AB0K74_45600 [Streptomyces sp. NPDC056159]|uniref:hypothetical protein n=1 Tax=Streptomyces sp. NPDC056159 TaxID=3155537 RepID=UPI00343EB9D3